MRRTLYVLPLVLGIGGVNAAEQASVNAFLEAVSKNGCEITEANNKKILSEAKLSEKEGRAIVQALFLAGGVKERSDGSIEVTAGPCG